MHLTVFTKPVLVTVRIVIVLSIFLLLNSCVFSLTEFYENPVDLNPVPPGISVVKLDLEADTVFAYSGRTVSFQFESDNQAIQGAKLLIDDVVVDSVESDHGTMTFINWYVPNGLHKLTLQIYTASGTGSISDKLGGESLIMAQNWVLLMDDTRSDNSQYKAENGFLKVYWERYKAMDFAAYVVVHDYTPVAEIKSPTQSYYIDSAYVGEPGSYTVYIKLTNGALLGWGAFSVPNALPTLRLSATPENEYRVLWNKCTYYNAISKFKFVLNSTIVSESLNLEDTTYLLNLTFNQSFDFSLNVVPKYPSASYSSNLSAYRKSLSDKTGIKLKIPENTNLQQIAQDVVAYKKSNSIFSYRVSTNSLLKTQVVFPDKLIWDLVLSPTGKYAMGYYFTGSSTRNYVLENLETEQITSVSGYESYTGGMSQGILLSDAGTGVIKNYSGSQVVCDYKTGGSLAYNFPNWSYPSSKSSVDGIYYVVNATDSIKVYALVNGQSSVKKVAAFANIYGTIDQWGFDTANPYLFYIVSNKRMIGLRCDQSVKVADFAVPESILSIDYFNKEILCYATNKFRIRSLTDGSLLKDIPLSFTPNPYGIHKLCNHYIIENGYLAYKVN